MARRFALSLLLSLLVACGGSDSEPASDTAAPGPDTSADVAADVGLDVSGDAPSDPDATPDAAPDADADTPDVRPDTAPDADAAEDTSGEDTPDVVADASPDVTPDTAPDADAAEETSVPPAGTVVVTPEVQTDAITSYLMDAAQSAWNVFADGTVKLGRHWDEGHVSYHTMLRFPGVEVPEGATIASATLSFHATNEVDSSNRLLLAVYAVDEADAAPWPPGQYETGRPDQRARTAARIEEWAIRCNDDCTDVTEYDCEQRKLDCWDREVRYACPKDLSAVVQEVVDREGWAPGNALALLLVNAAPEQAGEAYEKSRSVTGVDPERGPEYRPRLEITYE
ncbi:MAG: hypothetical protein ACQEXJ_09925 [Myxococcota bacterium]